MDAAALRRRDDFVVGSSDHQRGNVQAGDGRLRHVAIAQQPAERQRIVGACNVGKRREWRPQHQHGRRLLHCQPDGDGRPEGLAEVHGGGVGSGSNRELDDSSGIACETLLAGVPAAVAIAPVVEEHDAVPTCRKRLAEGYPAAPGPGVAVEDDHDRGFVDGRR